MGDKPRQIEKVATGEKAPDTKSEVSSLAHETENALLNGDPTKAIEDAKGKVGDLMEKTQDILKGSGEEVAEISKEQVEHLFKKSAENMTPEERQLLANYFTQQAEVMAKKDELLPAIIFRIRALFLQFHDIFGDSVSSPEISNDTPEELQKIPQEGEKLTEAKDKKISDTEKVARAIEHKHNIPAGVVIALAAIEGDFFLKNDETRENANTFNSKNEEGKLVKYDNVQACFDDFAARALKLMDGANIGRDKPAEYLTEYLKRKYKAEGKSEETIASETKDYLVKANLHLRTMYDAKKISSDTYMNWSNNIKESGEKLEKEHGISKKDLPTSKITRVDTTPLQRVEIAEAEKGKLAPSVKEKLGENLANWLIKCSNRFNVSPNIVAAFIKIESGFNPRAVNGGIGKAGGTKAQGMPQMMPRYIKEFYQRASSDLHNTPEIQHARGKGWMYVKESGGAPIKQAQVGANEYDPFDPYVGILMSAKFVRWHFNGLKKSFPKHMGKSFDSLSTGEKVYYAYLRHNQGPAGMWTALRKGASVLRVAEKTQRVAGRYDKETG